MWLNLVYLVVLIVIFSLILKILFKYRINCYDVWLLKLFEVVIYVIIKYLLEN